MVFYDFIIGNSNFGLKLPIPRGKMWSTGDGNGKPLQYKNPMNNSMKRQKDRTLKDELPRSVGAQYATGDQWKNNSRNNERWSQQKQHPVVDVTVIEARSNAVKSNIA